MQPAESANKQSGKLEHRRRNSANRPRSCLRPLRPRHRQPPSFANERDHAHPTPAGPHHFYRRKETARLRLPRLRLPQNFAGHATPWLLNHARQRFQPSLAPYSPSTGTLRLAAISIGFEGVIGVLSPTSRPYQATPALTFGLCPQYSQTMRPPQQYPVMPSSSTLPPLSLAQATTASRSPSTC